MSRGALALSAAALALAGCERVPDAPVPIVWDEQACSECHMHISDHRYAAELATDDALLLFDDPGCLFHWVAVHHPTIRHAWFRDSRHDAWIPRERVAFVPVGGTPMGYGLGAVPAGTPGAFGWAEAARRVTAGPRPEGAE